MRLLVTRPEPDASRTAAALRERGHTALVCPMLRIEAVANAPVGEGPWKAIAMSSVNAAEALSDHPAAPGLRGLPAFTVGDRTREAALKGGVSPVESADGDLTALARLIGARLGRGDRVLYLAGEDRAGDLAALLQPYGIAVHTAAIYRAASQLAVTAEAEEALRTGRLDGVLHYSQRSAEAFVAATSAAGLWRFAVKLQHACLSTAIAAPLAAAGAQQIRVADRPNQLALFELLNQS